MLEGPSFRVSRDVPNSCEHENRWIYNTFRLMELSNKKRRLEVEEKQDVSSQSCKLSDDPEEEETQINVIFVFPSHDQNKAGVVLESSSLIPGLDRDISMCCLMKCSRSDYGSIASLNRSFRSVIRSGEIYRLRRQMGIIEHWVYFSCNALEWDAFDPNSGRWFHLPRLTSNECFVCSDKESVAVGTELLLFGMEITAPAIYRYSHLTNSWTTGTEMNYPRCLFGSASLGEIAILAGGCDPRGNILNTAELYNSDTGTWEILPNMNKARKMCSGVFMDGKFYVLGGIGVDHSQQLTCGEEFDLKTRKWREIPNMFPARNGGAGTETRAAIESPPLVAVVNNVLYAADHAQQELRRYAEDSNSWVTIGRLPEQATSVNGWGLAFRACGNRLIVVGGPISYGQRLVEINAWVPGEGAPEWNLLASKAGSFVYNCAVMGC